MKIPQSVRDEIAKGPLAHLTTLNKDGSPSSHGDMGGN